MKKKYDLKKLRKTASGPVLNPKATKVQTSIRLDGGLMAWAQAEAHELGIGYQTFINMNLREMMEKPSIMDRLEAIESLKIRPGRLKACTSALKTNTLPEALLWQNIRELTP